MGTLTNWMVAVVGAIAGLAQVLPKTIYAHSDYARDRWIEQQFVRLSAAPGQEEALKLLLKLNQRRHPPD